MRRHWMAIGIVAIALVGACGNDTKGPDGQQGDSLDAKLVQFYPGTHTNVRKAAILTNPAQWNGFASWFTASSSGIPADDEIEGAPRPDKSYVATTIGASCRLAKSAELFRDGERLKTRLKGGKNREECADPYTAVAVFEVDTNEVKNVKQVNGITLSDPYGPGLPLEFIGLGTTPPGQESLSAELGTPEAAALLQQLETAQVEKLDEVRAAFEYQPSESEKAYAFVVTGCGETSAVMTVTPEYLESQAISDEAINCAAQMYYLATFHIESNLINPSAELR